MANNEAHDEDLASYSALRVFSPTAVITLSQLLHQTPETNFVFFQRLVLKVGNTGETGNFSLL